MEVKHSDSHMNATNLFAIPNSRFHSSEQFWSSLFALLILNLSNSENVFQMPAYRFFQDKEKWEYKHDGYFKIEKSLKLDNVVVDGRIADASFPGTGMAPLNNEFLELRPDILIIKDRRIQIIEVKTIGAQLTHKQIDIYVSLGRFLGNNEFQVEMYFLLSIGHEKEKDWTLVQEPAERENPFKILLWEDMLKYIDESTNEFKNSLGDISLYYRDKGLYLKGSFRKERMGC